jgi:hypothetical protein
MARSRRIVASIEQDENEGAAKAIMLLLLTGARRNEITYANAKWDYLDWEKKRFSSRFRSRASRGASRHRAQRSRDGALALDPPQRLEHLHLCLRRSPASPRRRFTFRGSASASATALPICACTICGIRLRAFW